jgi:protein associated with RNAse G/E
MEHPIRTKTINVSKRDVQGRETWRYQGAILSQKATQIVLEAYFDRSDTDLHGILLAKGDRFIETYYTDRWYNIFEIHAGDSDVVRGWYCNIACPAQLEENTLSYIDLALDLLVFPDGRQMILDEDEFAALDITHDLQARARAALEELRQRFHASLQMANERVSAR